MDFAVADEIGLAARMDSTGLGGNMSGADTDFADVAPADFVSFDALIALGVDASCNRRRRAGKLNWQNRSGEVNIADITL